MIRKILIIFIFFDIVSNKVDSVNTQDLIATLSGKYQEFRHVSEELVKNQTNYLTQMMSNLINGFRSYLIAEPTEKETKEADEAMADAYAIGDNRLPDNLEKMNIFCATRQERNATITNWVLRKYTFNLIVRLGTSLFIKKMDQKNDVYCANDVSKQDFIKNSQKLMEIKLKLRELRDRYTDSLAAIQNSILGIRKLGSICCNTWKYKNETLTAIQNTENREFAKDMMESYFGLSFRYICFYHTEGSRACSHTESFPQSARNHISLIIDVINAVSTISTLIP